MPPKQKKPNNHENNEEEEAPFQAVILTDSFEEQFLPISHEMPRVNVDCTMNRCQYWLLV